MNNVCVSPQKSGGFQRYKGQIRKGYSVSWFFNNFTNVDFYWSHMGNMWCQFLKKLHRNLNISSERKIYFPQKLFELQIKQQIEYCFHIWIKALKYAPPSGLLYLLMICNHSNIEQGLKNAFPHILNHNENSSLIPLVLEFKRNTIVAQNSHLSNIKKVAIKNISFTRYQLSGTNYHWQNLQILTVSKNSN